MGAMAMASQARSGMGVVVALGVLAVAVLAARGAEGEWPPAEFTNSIGMKFVRIPGGEFRMGSTEEEIKAVLAKYPNAKEEFFTNQSPAHKVHLTRAFLMGKHEVTVGQFRKFVEATRYKTEAESGAGRGQGFVFDGGDKPDASWRKPYFEQTDAHPVLCVSWNDARKFVEWLNASDKSRPAGWTYRLPTEAEWEYAARGPKSLIYPWGNEWDRTRCNFAGKGTGFLWEANEIDDGFARTAPVGSFSPKGDSPLGACDMAGNIWQWCEDWYATYQRGDQTDPTGPPTGEHRVWRGGSWAYFPWGYRSAYRNGSTPENREGDTGFRVVLIPGPQ